MLSIESYVHMYTPMYIPYMYVSMAVYMYMYIHSRAVSLDDRRTEKNAPRRSAISHEITFIGLKPR